MNFLKKKYRQFLKKVWLVDLILIVLLAIIAVFPAFIGHYYNASSDGFNHLDRFENIYTALKEGHLPSLFNYAYTPSNGHAGVAMNGLYPWIPSLIFVLPRFIISDPITSLAVGFIILNILTMLTAKKLMEEVTDNRWAMWAGVIIYQFNNFHLIDLYSRSDFGESFAYAWLPLVALGLIQIQKKKKIGAWILGIGMGLIANSHVLSLLMAFAFIVLYELLALSNKRFNWFTLRELLKAGILAVLIGFYSLYNIILIYSRAKVAEPAHYLASVDPLVFVNSFLQNSMGEKGYWAYGLPLLILQIVLTVILFKSNNRKQWHSWLIGADLMVIGILSWWPWDKLANTSLSLIQFLSRINLFIVLFLSIASAIYFSKYSKFNIKKLLIFEVAVCLFSISGAYQVHKYYVGPDTYHDIINTNTYHDVISTRYSFDEFLPKNKKTGQSELKNNNSSVEVKELNRKSNSVSYLVSNKTSQNVYFPTVMYDKFKYSITVNGIKTKSIEKNQVELRLAEGISKVTVESNDSYSTIPFIITIGSTILALLAVCMMYPKFNKRF